MDKSVYYMEKAIIEAKKAFEINEIPIGCVIVKNDQIISTGYNTRNTYKNTLYHAEIIAIDRACKILGDWRLEGCTMYVTVEPCPMCAGAIIQARLDKVVFGTHNKKAGFAGSVLNIMQMDQLNHKVEIESSILENESKELMQSFFKKFRKR